MKIMNTALALSLILFVNPSQSRASTFYVDTNNSIASDSNPGTQTFPWKTIGNASQKMVPGDTTLVLTGTYNELLSSTRSGSSGNRITFKASGTVKILGGSINHDYISIDGFNLDGGYIDITTGNYCEVLNNTFSPGYVTMHYLNSPDTPTGCLIKGNRFGSIANPDGDYVVIQIFGSNHLVEKNEIGPASDIDAFRFWGHDNIIRNNYVHDITYSPGSVAHMDGFQIFGVNGWACYNNVFEGNRLINSQGQLFMIETNGLSTIHDLIVRNNVFAHFGQNANLGMPNMQMSNNTFYDTGSMSGGKNANGDSTGAVWSNNIFIDVRGWSLNDYNGMFITTGLTTPWVYRNNFFSSGNGSPIANFSSGEQIGGINGGINYFTNVAANDFSIQSPSAVTDKGITLTGFNYDLLGTLRPQGSAWDIGAYEFKVGSSQSLLAPTNLRLQ
ncbi:MAG: choice-of-anchor Q domain-containing protein [Bdellovibrio sp.]